LRLWTNLHPLGVTVSIVDSLKLSENLRLLETTKQDNCLLPYPRMKVRQERELKQGHVTMIIEIYSVAIATTMLILVSRCHHVMKPSTKTSFSIMIFVTSLFVLWRHH